MKHIHLFRQIRQIIVRNKIRMQRTLSYISILNAGMIMFLVLSQLQDYGISIHITKWGIPIYILTLIGIIAVGWIDEKVGFFHEEQKAVAKKNPLMVELIDTIRRLETKVDNLERKLKK